jgi:hypothetical protein
MNSENLSSYEYQIALPNHLEGILNDSFKEAVSEEKEHAEYNITTVTDSKESSELKFDPLTITATVYVANIIVSSVAGYFIWKALDQLLKKTKPTAPTPGKIFVRFPNGTSETFDITTQEKINEAIASVKAKLP